jgi:pimeloyl-ACP methyl ester carboxylesterase
MDLRGHGQSAKPREGYTDSHLWADDVNAVIRALNLDRPVLSGWSYGPLVILDYIRHYGENSIGGIHFIGGITKLGSEAAMSVLGPEFVSLVPGFLSNNSEETVDSLQSLVRNCFAGELAGEDFYRMLGYNVLTPPYVRQGMFSRTFDNEDLLPKLRKPVLITQGTADRVVKPIAADQHKAVIPHAQMHIVAGGAHGLFWDEPEMFNNTLRAFCLKAAGAGALAG